MNHRTDRAPHLLLACILCIAPALGCSSESGGGAVAANDGNGGSGHKAQSACPAVELTQACSSCGAGRQVCTASGWSPCECGLDGASGAGAGASRRVVTAGALRTDITFDWEESEPAQGAQAGQPGQGGAYCIPGTYNGTYNLDFTPVLAPDFVTPTSGPFIIVFGTERKGEFLSTSEGSTLEVHFLEPLINAKMELAGGVHCGTGAFEASSVDCQFDINMIPGGPCEAHLVGMFDPATNSITGTIVSDVPGQGRGEGTFDITLAP